MDKIICVGKNYPAHAAELGEKQPEKPVLFLKPPSSLVQLSEDAPTVKLPPGDVHHELEIVLKISPPGAPHLFSAFTLGLDLTRRDLQTNLKKAGQPWEIAKVFAGSAIVGKWRPWTEWDQFKSEPFTLQINGETRQSGIAKDMLFDPAASLNLAREYFPILAGDLLFTGTPPGVGALKPQDQVSLLWRNEVFGRINMA